ncbi:hypothetical protein GCM10027052_06540 [Parafrigoribacterium mesophilum]|uniref:hypothetical protein n=1 Tax=Parafrigoribacterium mesophilum TaxID=433646 RepID=UPI0031FCF5FD
MSNTYYEPRPSTAPDDSARLPDRAASEGAHVAEVAKGEAGKVAGEARRQVRSLMDQARVEASDQAAQQQERAASGLRKVSEQLQSMGDTADDGLAGNLVREAAERTGSFAQWLDARDPGSLLDEVKGFARRRPGTFIAIAAVAGVAIGRLTRAVVSNATESDDTMKPPPMPSQYVAPAAPGLDTEFTTTDEFSDIRDVTP